MGRTKPDSVELDTKAPTSHVASTDQEPSSHLRRNMPCGTVADHGTMFVGFASSSGRCPDAGEHGRHLSGGRDALTQFARPLTGAYYFVPSIESLLQVSNRLSS